MTQFCDDQKSKPKARVVFTLKKTQTHRTSWRWNRLGEKGTGKPASQIRGLQT